MKMRVSFIVACALLAACAAHFGYPLVHDNSDAAIIMVTVMTVFAGFLVAILTILGDPIMIPKGSWRVAEFRHITLERIILRHTTLFYVYLLTIGLLFGGVLLRKSPVGLISENTKLWVEETYLFFAVFSFLLTLALPHVLGKIQMARSEGEIAARRAAEHIKPDSEL